MVASSTTERTQVGPAQSEVASPEVGLIERIRAGETDLFLELIQPYERSIYLLAFSVLRNEADAEETAQETVLKAFKYFQVLAPVAFGEHIQKLAAADCHE